MARALALMTTAKSPLGGRQPEGTNGESARAWRHVNSGRYKSEDPESHRPLVLEQADEKEQRKIVLGVRGLALRKTVPPLSPKRIKPSPEIV